MGDEMILEDPWEITEQQYPKAGTVREKLIYLLHYAILAPSSHNTQPWLFQVEEERVLLYADPTRSLAVIDPDDRGLIMSCGAALFHLKTAIRHFYLSPVVEAFPDPSNPDLLAAIQLGSEEAPAEVVHNLFRAIKKRRTNRMPFKQRLIPEIDVEALTRAATGAGYGVRIYTADEQKQKLADLIAIGDRIQGADRHFRRELASWIHPNRLQKKEGLPGYALGGKRYTIDGCPFSCSHI